MLAPTTPNARSAPGSANSATPIFTRSSAFVSQNAIAVSAARNAKQISR